MTRGNQREIDRERARKRNDKSTGKKKKTEGNASQQLTNKKESDAEIMRQKQEKARLKAEAAGKS